MFYSYPQNDTCVQKDMKCWQLLFGLWCYGILAMSSGIEGIAHLYGDVFHLAMGSH